MLAGVFRERSAGVKVRRIKSRPSDLTTDRTSTVRRDAIDQSSDGSSDDKSSDDTATATAAAWLYCVDVLCARRRDPKAAAEWLRANYASLASPAREKLADVVSAAAAKDRRLTTTTDAEARKPRDTVTARRSVSNEASSSEEASAVFARKTVHADTRFVLLASDDEQPARDARRRSRLHRRHCERVVRRVFGFQRHRDSTGRRRHRRRRRRRRVRRRRGGDAKPNPAGAAAVTFFQAVRETPRSRSL